MAFKPSPTQMGGATGCWAHGKQLQHQEAKPCLTQGQEEPTTLPACLPACLPPAIVPSSASLGSSHYPLPSVAQGI